ncbi:TatD family hydrolase [Chitinophagaceae bacterium MMS25-I14]
MQQYIDIHTHHPPPEHVLAIQNLLRNWQDAEKKGKYSIGLHPWYLNAGALQHDLQTLTQYADHPNVLAIGECGLDKVTQTDWHLQEQAFKAQILLANRHKKPLIIHCVRAYEELLHIFTEYPPETPVIIHGFNKKPELAQQLLKKGFYLAFGKILPTHPHVQESLAITPPDRFFLETDDGNISIEDIYAAATEIRKTGADEIILQLQKNFQTVFAK